MKNNKEELSSCIEDIMRKIVNPYMYVMDIPTGTGKTYSWAKLSAKYFPDHFDQILIFTVQNKLSEELMALLKEHQSSEESSLKRSDILYIKNNIDNIIRAVTDESVFALNDEMRRQAGSNEAYNAELFSLIKELDNWADQLRSHILNTSNGNDPDFLHDAELGYRNAVKTCIKKIFYVKSQDKTDYLKTVLNCIPSLRSVFPQVDLFNRKIIVTSINKIVCGIDMILAASFDLTSLSRDTQKRLIILDESDQCANSIRKELIKRAVDYKNRYKYIGNNYHGVHEILSFVSQKHRYTKLYLNNELCDALSSFEKDARKLWKSIMGDIEYYADIFLATDEDKTSLYNRGVFLIGAGTYIRLSRQQATPHSFICNSKDSDFFTLVHHTSIKELQRKYDKVVYMTTFVSLCNKIRAMFFNRIAKVVMKDYNIRNKTYQNNLKLSYTELLKRPKEGMPTIESSVFTLFSRFKVQSRSAFINSALSYMTAPRAPRIESEAGSFVARPNTFYSQGLQMHSEHIENNDYLMGIRLDSRDMDLTAEQLILNLINGYNTVILSSATASCSSVVANFDLEFFNQELGEKIQYLTEDERNVISTLLEGTYPSAHQIQVEPIAAYKPEIGNRKQLSLPEKYESIFNPEAVSSGLVTKWFKLTVHELSKNVNGQDNDNYLILCLNRLLQFAEVYYKFYTNNDIHSMLYFQNNRGIDDQRQYNVISCLIDGSYKDYSDADWDIELPDWQNKNLFVLKEWSEVERVVLPELSSSKDSKLMLIAAYNSIKAGCNLQYDIPDGLEVLYGDSWSNKKKDWDAIYLQSVTNYLSANRKSYKAADIEEDIYKILLSEAMFYERGYHSSTEVTMVVNQAVNNIRNFKFSAKGLVSLDKSAWMANVLEQSIGRLCRTKNKPPVTYIFYDSEIETYTFESVKGKAVTPEFRKFVDVVEDNSQFKEPVDREEKQRIKIANRLYDLAKKNLNVALRYTINSENMDVEYFDELHKDEEVPWCVVNARQQSEYLNETLAKYPTILSYDDLDLERRKVVGNLWSSWPCDEDDQYWYHVIKDEKSDYVQLVSHNAKGGIRMKVSEDSTRLSTMMKCPVIKRYFELKGYATEWKSGLLAAPIMMQDRYAGFIGEQAFISLLLHYDICCQEDIKVMINDFNYELADVVIQDSKGRNLIAFDVKNYNPDNEQIQDPRSLPFEEKLKEKMQRLKCRVVVVNVVDLCETTGDAQTRVSGLIDKNGNVISESIKAIKKMVYEAKRKQ